MPGGYGTKHNGVKIGVFWDGIIVSADGSQARITDAHVNIDRDVNISDSSNRLEWGGGAVTDGADNDVNVGGSGEKRIKDCSETWITLNYGSTKTATFTARAERIDYAGTTLTVSKSITYPARAYDPPAAPTNIAATLNMPLGQATVTWTNSPTAAAPVANNIVERSTNGGVSWVPLPTLPGSYVSFTDTGLSANSRYRYRVKSVSSAGSSAYNTMLTDLITTPAPPANCTAVKNANGSITVSWADRSLYEFSFEVLHASGSTWDASPIVTLPANTTSWTHPAPSTVVTHKYKVRATAGGLASSYSAESNSVLLLAAPLAPTQLLPSSANAIDASVVNRFSWKHNPVDSSAQDQNEMQYRIIGAGSWTNAGVVTSANQYRDIAASFFVNGNAYEWQMRTKGAHASFGPWSTSSTFVTSAKPSGVWSAPSDGGVVYTSRFTPQFLYTDPETKPMSKYRAQLVSEAGAVLEEVSQIVTASNSTLVPVPIAATLTNEMTYFLRGWVWDADGMMSTMFEAAFVSDFPVPMQPIFGDIVWNNSDGTVTIPWTNPDPAGGPTGTPDTATNTLTKSEDGGVTWEEVATDLPTNSAIVDWTAALNVEVIYRMVAYSSTPTSSTSEDAYVVTSNRGQWIFLNAGDSYTVWAKMRIDPDFEETYERPKTVWMFDSRDEGVETIGNTRERQMAVSGIIEPEVDRSTRDDFLRVADLPAPILYRDTRGRKWYCSIGAVKFKTKGLTTVSTVLTWVGKDVG